MGGVLYPSAAVFYLVQALMTAIVLSDQNEVGVAAARTGYGLGILG